MNKKKCFLAPNMAMHVFLCIKGKREHKLPRPEYPCLPATTFFCDLNHNESKDLQMLHLF